MRYIHFTPVSKKWLLGVDELGYYLSSAPFYENGKDEFDFLKNIFEVLDGE